MEYYCIGKATRYQEGTEVNRISYVGETKSEYGKLRSSVYASYEEAKRAADKAAEYNPVGFVVLILKRN